MNRRLPSRPTFKPRLETLETRDCPSGAGIALFMQSQTIQTGANAMQAHSAAASADFANAGKALQPGGAGITQALINFDKAVAEVQAVRTLNAQVQAEIAGFKQAVFLVAGDGDQGDFTFAIFAFFQVNGGFGASGGGFAGKATNALNEANGVASAKTFPNTTTTVSVFLPGGLTTIDGLLSSP